MNNRPDNQADNAVDSLVQQHPLVKATKNEAKALKKNQHDLSLMQAQTVIARKKGFNNWHDLLQKIKLVFNRDFKYNQLISAEKNVQPEDGYMHLGRSRDFGLEQWINQSTARTHLSIYDAFPNIASMDIYLAEQALGNNSSLFFMCEDQASIEHLTQLAIKNGRHESLYIFDYQDILGYDFQPYFTAINPFTGCESGSITEFLFTLLQESLPQENMYRNKIIGLLSALCMTLVYRQNKTGEDLTWHHFSVINPYAFFETVLNDDTYPEHIQTSVRLAIKDKELIEQTNFIKHYYQTIQTYKQLSFNGKSYQQLDLKNVINSDIEQPVVLVLLPKRKEISKQIYYHIDYRKIYILFLTHLKAKMTNLLGTKIDSSMSYSDVIERKPKKIPSMFIMRDPYFVPGTAIMPAQSRSLGLSMVFSYSEKFDTQQSSEEIERVTLNTNLQMFSGNPDSHPFFRANYNLIKNTLLTFSANNDKQTISYPVKKNDELKEHEYLVFFKGMNQTIKLIKMH